ncbi:MAG: site-specific integrase [Methylosarcina sp.]
MTENEDTPERSPQAAIDALKGEFGAIQAVYEGQHKVTLPTGEEKTVTARIERNLASMDESKQHTEYLSRQLREEAKREQETAEILQKEKRAEELHRAQLAAIAASTITSAPLPTKSASKSFAEYFDDYKKYQTTPDTEGGWKSETTMIRKSGVLNCFLSQYGIMNASGLSWQDAKKYVKLARAIPPYFTNPSHKAKFIGLTIDMLLDDGIDTSNFKPRKPSAIWNDLKTVRAFLDWIRAEYRIKELQDAIEELDKEIGRTNHNSDRREFTTKELKILFEQDNTASENYIKGFNSKRGVDANLKFWLPLLGLYTGATLAELCQLHLSDIYLHKSFDGSNHWVIDINNDGDKRTKNDSRPRLIPVHKKLLELGLLDYINKLAATGETKLFPTAKRGKDGAFGAESQWWGEYSSSAGITDRELVFHSFRTTLLDTVRNKHVDRDIIAAIAGHTISTTAEKHYRKGDFRKADIGPLVPVINSIDYGLNHPKWNNY